MVHSHAHESLQQAPLGVGRSAVVRWAVAGQSSSLFLSVAAQFGIGPSLAACQLSTTPQQGCSKDFWRSCQHSSGKSPLAFSALMSSLRKQVASPEAYYYVHETLRRFIMCASFPSPCLEVQFKVLKYTVDRPSAHVTCTILQKINKLINNNLKPPRHLFYLFEHWNVIEAEVVKGLKVWISRALTTGAFHLFLTFYPPFMYTAPQSHSPLPLSI